VAADGLPDDGELRLGLVMLPAGRRVLAEQGEGAPVAWATRQGLRYVSAIAASLAGAPVWTFWWD